MSFGDFEGMFHQATDAMPFPYQKEFAEADELFELVHAPTGSGKTATAILGWLWRYFYSKKPTPRRLAYCLPMRVLVEQTRNEAIRWVHRLGRLAPSLKANGEFDPGNPEHVKDYHPDVFRATAEQVAVFVLMGGEDAADWDLFPEKPAVLIGTQDMLLSRALNRGYGMSRFRWPMHYALLNNDCLWVLDEIQLMGVGLATSAQLQAFRNRFGTYGQTKTVWMSATLLPSWLETIDFRDQVPENPLKLSTADYTADGLKERWEGKKPIEQATATSDDPDAVAAVIKNKHLAGSLTLAVVNTVNRSRAVFEALKVLYPPERASRGNKTRQPTEAAFPAPDLKLIHSRFRPIERKEWMACLKPPYPPQGRIVISTQVVEAGVDMSARTLLTELAPWPSLVQRFGRCNRRGEFTGEQARVFWIDVPAEDDKAAAPYAKDELDSAREQIKNQSDVGLKRLDEFFKALSPAERTSLFPYNPPHVVRRKDFIDLFDTTTDLAGNDIDVSRFIREGEELDVHVFWRHGEPDATWSKAELRRNAPRREELCTVGFVSFRNDFLRKGRVAFRWDSLDGRWRRMPKADAASVLPGQVYWIPADQGGYDPTTGWDPDVKEVEETLIPPLPEPERATKEEAAYDDDDWSRFQAGWQTIAEHTQEVVSELEVLLMPKPDASRLPVIQSEITCLRIAARWHDWGKAHPVFQAAIKKPEDRKEQSDLAKAPDGCWLRRFDGQRKHFRHELASAIAVLTLLRPGKVPLDWASLPAHLQDLAVYLIAAHHGKVRLSIRSMPDENKPEKPGRLFARGVWDGETLRGLDLGDGVVAPDVDLDLSPMQLGREADGRPSWGERMLRLRDNEDFGPCKLALLEAILRAADMRASKKADERAKVNNA